MSFLQTVIQLCDGDFVLPLLLSTNDNTACQSTLPRYAVIIFAEGQYLYSKTGKLVGNQMAFHFEVPYARHHNPLLI